MGWANCGKDDFGRPIGYANKATCDRFGCKAEIDRGLSYACGGMHGEDEVSCGQYFCAEHLVIVEMLDGEARQLCESCAGKLSNEGGIMSEEG